MKFEPRRRFIRRGLYHDVNCQMKNCFLCQFMGDKNFKLSGLCVSQELIDTMYTLVTSLEQFTFRGLLGRTNITLNKATNNWEIVSHALHKTLGHVFGFTNLQRRGKFILLPESFKSGIAMLL
jgi:hypothetical protein